jgi:hypothetical protein
MKLWDTMQVVIADLNAVRSAGAIEYIDSGELFQRVSNGEKVFVEGAEGISPGFSVEYQENEDMLIKEDPKTFVEHITVDHFKKKSSDVYRLTESTSKFYSIQDDVKDIVLKELIQKDEQKM